MPDPQILDDALRRLAAGDGQAFDRVFDELWPLFLGYCRKVLPYGGPAEDTAQSALLNLFEQASCYDPRRPALPWAFSFVVWACRTERSRARRESARLGPEDAVYELSSSAPSPEEALSRCEELALASSLARELDASEHELLWHEVQPELRRAIDDVKPSTIRKRRQRLLERLRLAWRRIVQPEEDS